MHPSIKKLRRASYTDNQLSVNLKIFLTADLDYFCSNDMNQVMCHYGDKKTCKLKLIGIAVNILINIQSLTWYRAEVVVCGEDCGSPVYSE